jgi:spore coat protein H
MHWTKEQNKRKGELVRKIITTFIIIIAGIILAYFTYSSAISEQEPIEQINVQELIPTIESQVTIESSPSINELPLQDNMAVYQYDDPTSIVYMYVTIRKGNEADNTDHTWQEVNDFTKFFYDYETPIEVGKAETILQIGDEKGPLPGQLGYGETIPNATIQIRGSSTSKSPQKSYKIELRERGGEWRGQRTIALNKHVYDVTRIRNKLCFDLLKDIPNITSLRTQYVQLLVKDETSDPPSESFSDYGLFTQIEQPNGRFLHNHLLDNNAQLYKPTTFEFYRYPDQLRLPSDPLYNEVDFTSVLEIKGNRDSSKLIQMLEDINNWEIPIQNSFEKYFDKQNVFTWLAFNILIGNVDTQSTNFYLYSPQNSIKWYFLPWDYDGSLQRQERIYLQRTQYNTWEIGISNYWGNILMRRILMREEYRKSLDEKIKELKEYLSTERLSRMVNDYRGVTEVFIFRMPDILYNQITYEDYNYIMNTLPQEIDINYQLYLESLNKPMPFFLGTPKIEGNNLLFIWGESYDFDAQNINYNFELSDNWTFENILTSKTTTNIPMVEIERLEAGTYFWRVTATNEDGESQTAFDDYFDAERVQHSGMKYLFITEDGKILEE